ncbi:MAG: prepilin-type N-terminal cleavage/methylation domain-containing protein [Pseudomonadota bacterium]
MIAQRRRAVKGFTLIEVLVALTILSMVMVATVTGMRTLARTQVSLEAVTTRNDEVRAVSSFLRDAFESAVLGSSSGGLSLGGGQNEATVFEMSPTSLIWKTGLRFGESAGGSYVVRIADEAGDLALRWQQMGADGRLQPWNNVSSRTLVEGLQEFSVAYRRRLNGPWVSRWDSQGAPGWVRLRVKANDRFWPDLVMVVAR